MTRVVGVIILSLFVLLMFTRSSCSGAEPEDDDGMVELTSQETASLNLTGANGTTVTSGSKTWNLGTIKKDGTDITSDFTDFSLTLMANKQWSTTAGGDLWASNGTYTLTAEVITIGDRALTFTSDGSTLMMNFTISNNTPIGGKPAAVDGKWELNLVN